MFFYLMNTPNQAETQQIHSLVFQSWGPDTDGRCVGVVARQTCVGYPWVTKEHLNIQHLVDDFPINKKGIQQLMTHIFLKREGQVDTWFSLQLANR